MPTPAKNAEIQPGREWYRDARGSARWTDTGGFATKAALDPAAEFTPEPAKPSTGGTAQAVTAKEGAHGVSGGKAPATIPAAADGLDDDDLPPADVPESIEPEERPAPAEGEDRGAAEGQPAETAEEPPQRPQENPTEPVEEPPPPAAELPPAEPEKTAVAADSAMNHAMAGMAAQGAGVVLTRVAGRFKGATLPLQDDEREGLTNSLAAVLEIYLPALHTEHPELWNLAAVSAGIVLFRLSISREQTLAMGGVAADGSSSIEDEEMELPAAPAAPRPAATPAPARPTAEPEPEEPEDAAEKIDVVEEYF